MRKKLIYSFSSGYNVRVYFNIYDNFEVINKINQSPNIFIKNIKFDNSYNIYTLLHVFFKLTFEIIKYKPTAIYSFTIKPNLIAILTSHIFTKKIFVSTFTGLGNLYLKNQKLYNLLFKFILFKNNKNLNIIFHNLNDLNIFKRQFKHKQLFKVNGSGINKNKNQCKSLKDKSLKVLTISRLIKEKGIDNYLEIVHHFKNDKRISFTLVSNLKNISKKINTHRLKILKQKKYLNFIDDKKDFKNIFLNYDIFLLLSEREGLSHALINSLNFGLPAITLNVPGNTEIIKNGFNGYLVDNYKDQGIIKKKIVRLINSILKYPNLYKRLSKNANNKIDLEYSHKFIYEFYMNFLK